MRRQPRRRHVLGLLALSVVAPGIGCGTGAKAILSMSAEQFAHRFIKAKVERERLIVDTCERVASRKSEDLGAFQALKNGLEFAKKHELAVIAKAACKGGFCGGNAIQVNAEATALIQAMARAASLPESDVTQQLQQILADTEKQKSLLPKLALARAGLFVALKLGDTAQKLSDRVADAIPIAGAFARPLLDIVTQNLVASVMDQGFSVIEEQFKVPRVHFTAEACSLYQRAEPRADATGVLLERAILRYAKAEKVKTWNATYTVADCKTLTDYLPEDSRAAGGVCAQILATVDVKSAQGPFVQEGEKEDARVEQALLPKPPRDEPLNQENQIDEESIQKEANALVKSAAACAEAYEGERLKECTLERIAGVASLAYANAVTSGEDVSSAELRFDAMELRVADHVRVRLPIRYKSAHQWKRPALLRH